MPIYEYACNKCGQELETLVGRGPEFRDLCRPRIRGDQPRNVGERLLASEPAQENSVQRVVDPLRHHQLEANLFENANDIIYTLDMQRRITSVNRRAEQTFGFTREECMGRNVAELIPPEYHARMEDALRRKLSGEESPTTYEVEAICKDGRRVPLEVWPPCDDPCWVPPL